jgi:NitT/TauT family transport system substrate-binding protein
MRSLVRVVAVVALWVVLITLAHGALNLDVFKPRRAGDGAKTFKIGFLPVTCHLTCPVTHFINKSMTGEEIFDPVRFNGWPELKEAYLSGYTPATFILAPMAMRAPRAGCAAEDRVSGASRRHGDDGA